jgi:transcription initiation factor IIE alpha subunit
MTSQTKRYIEVPEIIALRFDCKHCGASLSLPLARDVGKSLLKCPRCGEGWARLENSTSEVLIEELVEKIEKLSSILPYLGFRFYLEIASDHASGDKD